MAESILDTIFWSLRRRRECERQAQRRLREREIEALERIAEQSRQNIEICQPFHDGTEFNELGEANSHLISAAPDLAYAAQEAWKALAWVAAFDSEDGILARAREMIEAAVRKSGVFDYAAMRDELLKKNGIATYRQTTQAVGAAREKQLAEAIAERNALRVQVEQQKWQPIETAPHETRVLLGFYYGGAWFCETGMASHGWNRHGVSTMSRHGQATHWQTLPDAPAVASTDGSGA